MKTMSEKSDYCHRMNYDTAQTALFHLGCACRESGLYKKEYDTKKGSILTNNTGISKFYLNELSRNVFAYVMLNGGGVESFYEFNRLIQPQLRGWNMNGNAVKFYISSGIYFEPVIG